MRRMRFACTVEEKKGMRAFRPSQSDKNIWHVLWGAVERGQWWRRRRRGRSGAAELSCQLCEKLRFMRVARDGRRGMQASYCQKLQNSH